MSPHYLFAVTPSKSKAPRRWASLLRPHPKHEGFMAEPDVEAGVEAESTNEKFESIKSPPKSPKSISTLLTLNFSPRAPSINAKSKSPSHPSPSRFGLDLERKETVQARNNLFNFDSDPQPVGKSTAPHSSPPSISITPPLAQGPHSTGSTDSAPPLALTPTPGPIQTPQTTRTRTVSFTPIPPTIDPTPPRLQRLHFTNEPLIDLSKPPMNKYFPLPSARTSPSSSFKFSATEERPIYKGRSKLKHKERLRPTQKPSMRRYLKRSAVFYADRTM